MRWKKRIDLAMTRIVSLKGYAIGRGGDGVPCDRWVIHRKSGCGMKIAADFWVSSDWH